jgi:hypothetical protein
LVPSSSCRLLGGARGADSDLDPVLDLDPSTYPETGDPEDPDSPVTTAV